MIKYLRITLILLKKNVILVKAANSRRNSFNSKIQPNRYSYAQRRINVG